MTNYLLAQQQSLLADLNKQYKQSATKLATLQNGLQLAREKGVTESQGKLNELIEKEKATQEDLLVKIAEVEERIKKSGRHDDAPGNYLSPELAAAVELQNEIQNASNFNVAPKKKTRNRLEYDI